MTGMGAGLTWGSALIEWTHQTNGASSMTKIAFMFPGQGSFEAGMGREIAEAEPEAMAVYDAGSEASGLDLQASSASSGPAEELVDTEVQQPALVATSLAINAALRARGIAPDYVVGHSVGEFSALGSAQSIVRRARRSRSCASAALAMAEAAQSAPRLDGRDPRPRRRGRRGALPEDPQRVAGELQLPRPARHLGRDAGGRRVLRRGRSAKARAARSGCRVSGAFHSPLVAHAAERLRPAIDEIDFKAPTCAVHLDGDGEARGRAALPRAARRAADRAGEVHAGGARADRGRA